MSIHFISGKPGGGKTLYSTRLIIDELVRSDRCVITNVPLLLPRLNEYIQERHPKAYQDRFVSKGIHISDRVILLQEDDLSTFFTWRPNGVRLPSVTNAEWKAGKKPDYSAVNDAGVLYVLDEVHVAFNARAWADTGHEVLYYLSQHRKLGDDVICITQAVSNVDKQFRSVAQDYTYIKNLSKQKIGLFRLPALFTRNTYGQPATDTSKPMETGSFTMDVSGIASCYDTARGVGIHGRAGADTNERKKGVHWLWFAGGLILFLWFVSSYLPTILAHITTPKVPPSVHSPGTQPQPANRPGGKPQAGFVPDLEVSADTSTNTSKLPQPTNAPLYCVAYALFPGEPPQATLSDGQVYEPPELQMIAKRFVVVDGVRYMIRLAQPGTDYVPPPASQQFDQGAPVVNYESHPGVQVTVIGQNHRQAPPLGSGFAKLSQRQPIQN